MRGAYLERDLLTKGDPVQARADLTAAFVAANPTTKTYYQIAAETYAAKLLADAGNTGGTVNPPVTDTGTTPTGTIGSATNPYTSMAALVQNAGTASSTTLGQTAYVGTTKYKVTRHSGGQGTASYSWDPIP